MSAVLHATAPPGACRRPSGTGIALDVRTSAAELAGLVPEWEALAAEAAEPNPFYEPWMLLPALEAYGEGEGLRCVAVWQDGTLAALFPMRLEAGWRHLPVRALRSWRHRNMLFCAPLVRPRGAAKSILALLRSGLAPLVEFDWIAADGPFYGALVEAAGEAGLPWMVTDAYARALLARDPRPRFNSNMKNNLRRWQAKLRAHGEVAPVRLAAGANLAPWMEDFIALEASGWKAKAGSAIACRAEERQFVTAVFREAHRRGRLLVTGLDLAGRPLARHCMLVAGEGAFTFKIAYDEAHAAASPGILAEVENVRQFLETPGLCWVDSNTARENTSYGRVWKERRTMQRVAVGTAGAGRLAVAALPLARLVRQGLRRR
jgi:hypothetical protein